MVAKKGIKPVSAWKKGHVPWNKKKEENENPL